ncbi:hypothetical protein SAMD00019534_002080 [Acytostelium subglobosum LB1]|uniref:hypothetical protein n=1 Tax=Acytostelium subglobosum LB1 TaxID=1410327 RepID=UPI000644B9C8|nr:hypothetical protein SAMD00019534_002080 [Acytostelium subglobosum LB1]GAM17033.1 hypothetical protein SAMD00019534_002080 [Acytostelium subglobosum LB1]|eukprot:XP_012759095.1 hypothetical protein SAMD00019534_002080 [Acytostelium subglobosum LB1]
MYEVEADPQDTDATQASQTMKTTATSTTTAAGATGQQSKQPSEYMRVQRMFRQVTKNERTGKNIPKEKRKPIDYSSVLDYHNLDNNTPENRERILDFSGLVDQSTATESPYYAHPATWRVYGLKDYPGFYFIPSPFSVQQQKKWIKDAIELYTEPPNSTNLTLFHGDIKQLWRNAQQEFSDIEADSRGGDKSSDTQTQTRPLDKNGQELPTYRSLLDKLAWSSLGYQYQWTERIYSEDYYVQFPDDLQQLVTHIASSTRYTPYVAEAATINFYSEDSVMGGHLDDAEEEMEKPIVSISFGSTAVFLMGAETKDVAPVPIFIRSGDIVIMGGRSRYCYHGVAKIVEDSFDVDLAANDTDDTRWHIHWLKEKNRRININTRQVFKVPKQGVRSTIK